MAEWLGLSVSVDDAYTVLRGMRTLAVRLDAHQEQARSLVEWFRYQPFVARVFFPPAGNSDADKLWRRDFSGACGLFTVEFQIGLDAEVEAFVDRLTLFGIGSSWGGYESLARIENAAALREVSPRPSGPVVRFHAGLEDLDDLIADLATASVVFQSAGVGGS